MISHIVFDFDGTLVDSTKLLFLIDREFAIKYNLNALSDSEMKLLNEIKLQDRFKKLGIKWPSLLKFLAEYDKIYFKHFKNIHLIKGMPEVLHQLKSEGYHLHILSFNIMKRVERILKNINITSFDKLFASRMFSKSHLIKKMIKTLKIQKNELVYIGDEIRDIKACRKAGIPIIAVTWGLDSIGLLGKDTPDCIADKPSDLIKIIHDF